MKLRIQFTKRVMCKNHRLFASKMVHGPSLVPVFELPVGNLERRILRLTQPNCGSIDVADVPRKPDPMVEEKL